METQVELAKVVQGRGRAVVRRNPLKMQDAMLLVVVATLTLFFYIRNPAMLAAGTVRSILATASYPALVGLGLVMLMIAGEIDLSTGPVMGACAVFSAWLMLHSGWPAWAAAAGGLVMSLGVGLVNGLLTVKLRAPSLVATLAVGITIRGASYMLSPGVPIYPLAPEVAVVGDMRLFGLLVVTVAMLVVLVVVQTILRQTRWGAAIYATGGNRLAAERCGINTDRVKIACFMLTSLLAGCSGLLIMCQLKAGDPIIGRTLELSIITGVVLGGASFSGGRGSAFGSVLGAILVQIIKTGLVLVRVNPNWHGVILGVLLATAAAIDARGRRRRV